MADHRASNGSYANNSDYFKDGVLTTGFKILPRSSSGADLSALSETEKKQFQQLDFPKKQWSFLAGRLAAKKAVIKAFEDLDNQEITIANSKNPDMHGQPLAQIPGHDHYIGNLSLSHSYPLAAACFHKELPVGVDLERSEARDPTFFEIAFSEEERDFLFSLDPKDQVDAQTILWTAKEAMSKVTSEGLSRPINSWHVNITRESLLSLCQGDVDKVVYHGFDQIHLTKMVLQTQMLAFSDQKYYLTIALPEIDDRIQVS